MFINLTLSLITEAMWRMSLQREEGVDPPYPERIGELDCPYYMRTGLCGFGANCKFNHPPSRRLVRAYFIIFLFMQHLRTCDVWFDLTVILGVSNLKCNRISFAQNSKCGMWMACTIAICTCNLSDCDLQVKDYSMLCRCCQAAAEESTQRDLGSKNAK